MQMKIYHNPRCRKSRETLQLIRDSGQEPEVVEYLKHPPSEDELREVLDKLGLKPSQVARKGERLYKEEIQGRDLSEDEMITALVDHPILIERPIVVSGDKAVIGRPPEKVQELLDKSG